MDKRTEIEQAIRNLQSELSSQASEIGDWKIVKCMEHQSLGLEIPYDLQELHGQRQSVRDKIGELERQLEEILSEE